MTWRWRTCFSRWLVAALLVPAALAASVEGTVELRTKAGIRVKDRSNVLIWLTPRNARPVPAPQHTRMLQKGKMFIPHLLVVDVGSTVDFPNLDPIFHNAFSNFNGQIFDIGLYAPGQSRPIVFRRPGIVRVFCNIHPTMSAVIAVLETPYFAVSRADGTYAIHDVPPGSYEMRVFEERATEETLTALARVIQVNEGANPQQAIRVEQSDFLPLQHKNKYGQDYPHEDHADGYGGPQ